MVIKEQGGEVAVEERDVPAPEPRQVLIWVHTCGVCHDCGGAGSTVYNCLRNAGFQSGVGQP